jgi:hypothetical protein
MTAKTTRLRASCIAVLAMVFCAAGHADSLIGLQLPGSPDSSLNIGAYGYDTLNSGNAEFNDYIVGGALTNGGAGAVDINTVSVYAVDGAGDPWSTFGNMGLYFGALSGTYPLVSTSYWFEDTGLTYGSVSGLGGFDIWRITFSVPDLSLSAGDSLGFAVYAGGGAGPGGVNGNYWFLSTCSLMANPEGCEGNVNGFYSNDLSNNVVELASHYTAFEDYHAMRGDAYVTAQFVTPEPAAWLLMGAGLGLMRLLRRRG